MLIVYNKLFTIYPPTNGKGLNDELGDELSDGLKAVEEAVV
jgi:hypothetical protein